MKSNEETKAPEDPKTIFPYGEPGPSQFDIDEMKAKHGKLELVTLAAQNWIYRQMSRTEHLDLLDKGLMDTDSDSLVVRTLLVWPDPAEVNWDDYAAGIVPSLSAEMLVFSGFVRTTAPISI